MEEERLKLEAEAKEEADEAEQLRVASSISTRAFRRRCLQAAASACVLLLLLLLLVLHRAGRLPLRLRRMIIALLLWLRRR